MTEDQFRAPGDGATPDLPDEARRALQAALYECKRVIIGQDAMLERVLVALLTGGHVLLEGVPGLAKTLTVRTLAQVLGGSFSRVQFTPDLVPADLVGTRIWQPDHGTFRTEVGPVSANLLLADEINRAPAKVQSALLEVMAEHQVTIGGTTYPVPEPFFVVATQNPIESEGVYQLPDAQRDRFMMKIDLPHPTADEELMILDRMSVTAPHARQVLTLDGLRDLQATADRVFVDRSVSKYAIDLVQATRHPDRCGLDDLSSAIALGVSPRATLNLVRGARAMAVLRGRSYTTPQDVFDIAPEVLRHRLLLTYDALARDITPDHVVNRILASVPASWVSPRPNHVIRRG
jgi:MoxR-like ATPase